MAVDSCNGPKEWQGSLVSAIRTASPLPAPPDPSVYADVLSLAFTSEGFQAASSLQGFEPGTRVANTDKQSALESFEQFAKQGQKDPEPSDTAPRIIHLTIIGSPPSDATVNESSSEPPLPPDLQSPDPPQ